jgi:hypothetical protein
MIALSPTHPAVARARDLMAAGRPAALAIYQAAQEYGRPRGAVSRGLSARRSARRRVVAVQTRTYWYSEHD